jgi:hypothetical protein
MAAPPPIPPTTPNVRAHRTPDGGIRIDFDVEVE